MHLSPPWSPSCSFFLQPWFAGSKCNIKACLKAASCLTGQRCIKCRPPFLLINCCEQEGAGAVLQSFIFAGAKSVNDIDVLKVTDKCVYDALVQVEEKQKGSRNITCHFSWTAEGVQLAMALRGEGLFKVKNDDTYFTLIFLVQSLHEGSTFHNSCMLTFSNF